jgi:cytochrome c oxidase assembly protein subunit 15
LDNTATRGFYRLSLSTLVAVFLLILVGGVVRSTGSGMGCPDWPKCFGSWVPPSSVDELPVNYKDQYAAHREKKNKKFVAMLRGIGMAETASKIEADPTILVEEEFNVTKTRVEYANRVVGVIIGIMISFVLLRSFQFIKTSKPIFVAAFLAWISVVFTGWFGSIVVSTNLTPWTISVHLGFAFLIVGLLVYTTAKTATESQMHNFSAPWLLWICMLLLLIQVFMGVQVREVLDQIANAFPADRSSWISRLGTEFIVHRSFSWLLVLVNGYLVYQMVKNSIPKFLWGGLVALTLASVLTGTVMAYASVPAFIQPIHLLLSALNFGLLTWVILMTRKSAVKPAYE